MSLQFDPHSEYLACGTRNAAINIYDLESGELFKEIQRVDPRDYEIKDTGPRDVLFPVMGMRWIQDMAGEVGHDTLMAAYANSSIKFWNANTGSKDYEINERENYGIYALDYTQVGDKFVTGGADRCVRVY